jgi:hypothetical protein
MSRETIRWPVEPQIYTVETFCRIFAVSRAGFYRMIQRGEGPAVLHIGKRTLISVEAADEWRRRMEQINAGLAQRVTPRSRQKPDEATNPAAGA